ncbi:MAG: hypothetical protein LBL19_07990 [Spirochaetaceae bacterium]|jgi:hypothetical protein|nr:hypothetical protein [Spirochaetaceae bacterium]
MAIFFTKKLRIIQFFLSLGLALLCILGMDKLLSGPRLGPYYDFLMGCRQAPPLSGEIALIETGTAEPPGEFSPPHFIEPETAASVLMTLTEMEASAVILQVPMAGLSSGAVRSASELTFRFDEEFGRLKGNIRNLFEALRIGSIPPSQAAAYVEELLNLADQGKERLLFSFVPQEETRVFEQAAAVFGRTWKTSGAGYVTPAPDPDGVLRRIIPVPLGEEEPGEHLVYTALKDRYKTRDIEYTKDGPVLRLVKSRDGESLSFPLDKEGAFLIEKPGKNQDFKRLPLSLLMEYEEADRELYRLLTAAASLGIYGGLNPEKYPPVLYEYGLSLRMELLREPDEEKRRYWREGREGYFSALEDFCYGPGEMTLVSGYEELIASENMDEESLRHLRGLRDELIRTFRDIREKYNALTELRGSLKSLLYGSFCILGPGGGAVSPASRETEASAILANSLLSGSVIRTAPKRSVLLWSLAAAGFLSFCLIPLRRLLFSLGLGFSLSVLAGIIFSASFVLSAYWIDPFIPLAAAGVAALSSTLFSLVVNRRFAGLVRQVYGASLPPVYLETLLRAGESPVLTPVTAVAAVITVRNDPLAVRENQGEPREAARNGAAFREELFQWCQKTGGIMAGWEGDTALIAFGSPPERAVLKIRGKSSCAGEPLNPVTQAINFFQEILKGSPDGSSWYFGLDVGECAFVPIPGSGYRVYGPPAACSRLLSKFAPRYEVPILITRAVQEKAGSIPVRAVRVSSGSRGTRTFYTLVMGGQEGLGAPPALS